MRPPSDFEQELSESEKKLLTELIGDVEKTFEDGAAEFSVHTVTAKDAITGEPIPRRIWEALVQDAQQSGWKAELAGANLLITRP